MFIKHHHSIALPWIIIILILPLLAIGQPAPGGIQGDETLLLTPDPGFNASITQSDIRDVSIFGFDDLDRLTITPKFDYGWNWMAAFNVPYRDDKINWFMYDGWLYITQSLNSNMRRRRFHEDITGKVSSNAYHMAFYYEKAVEREIVMLVVSPEDQTVELHLDSGFFGKDEVVTYDMSAGEAKFVHIIMPPEERTKVTWQEYVDPRVSVELDGEWGFVKGHEDKTERPDFSRTAWEQITIPHSWNARDIFDQRNIMDKLDIMEMYHRGIGWYRKTFELDASWDGQRIELSFLGANQVTDVWLNGTYLGQNIGGYLGFDFDVTEHVEWFSTNELVVKVDNRFSYDIPPHTADFNFYGGLYREVFLNVTDPVYINNTRVEAVDVSHRSARVEIRHLIENISDHHTDDWNVITNLLNPYGEIIQTIKNDLKLDPQSDRSLEFTSDDVSFPMLWSPNQPHMYEVYTVLKDGSGNVMDKTREPLGFRWYDFDADRGFILNGEPMKLQGVNFHQDYLNRGNAVSIAQKKEDLQHIKDMGVNFVRLAHYPHHPVVMDLADRLGLLVWAEIPWVNTIGGDAFADNSLAMMRGMIERDFNHPSVILWGIGNEFAMGFIDDESLQRSKDLAQRLHDLSKSLDPNRLTVQAHNEVVDVEMMEITDVQGRNRYFGWYEATYDDFAKALDEEREKYPHWKILISEYGAEGKYGYHVTGPAIFDHSETYQRLFHQAHWEAMNDRDWVSGGALWNMFDFGSHVKIGNIPHINQKGTMTMDRIPKAVYRYYQSQWLAEPMVYIVSHTKHHKKLNGDGTTTITVYSNCDEVELRLNDQSVGTLSDKDVFTWEIQADEGVYHIEAVGTKDGVAVKDRHRIYYYNEE